MITVSIAINGIVIAARSATNISSPEVAADKNFENLYKCDDGTIIKHVPSDGAADLAKKMLDTLVDI